eukprot:TRINITY_DN167_c0_g2_i3.p1 TRINITY_DN167_c0_g2~~TRINITY_DN167_c0_g2_i3.p1  ORF type:complete len:179 (+),score=0.39 TRINITY_DN167_c0_g2_i3:37-573(+)
MIMEQSDTQPKPLRRKQKTCDTIVETNEVEKKNNKNNVQRTLKVLLVEDQHAVVVHARELATELLQVVTNHGVGTSSNTNITLRMSSNHLAEQAVPVGSAVPDLDVAEFVGSFAIGRGHLHGAEQIDFLIAGRGHLGNLNQFVVFALVFATDVMAPHSQIVTLRQSDLDVVEFPCTLR